MIIMVIKIYPTAIKGTIKDAASVIRFTPPRTITAVMMVTIIPGIHGEIFTTPVTADVIELFWSMAMHTPTAKIVVIAYAMARGLFPSPFVM